jgi:hypothetical protein
MALFPLSCVLRGFPAAAYRKYASPKILVRPCSTKKPLIYELDTLCTLYECVDGHKLMDIMRAKDVPIDSVFNINNNIK